VWEQFFNIVEFCTCEEGDEFVFEGWSGRCWGGLSVVGFCCGFLVVFGVLVRSVRCCYCCCCSFFFCFFFFFFFFFFS
jgi:hypothetical protein